MRISVDGRRMVDAVCRQVGCEVMDGARFYDISMGVTLLGGFAQRYLSRAYRLQRQQT
jgi:hypothetical protein